MRVPTAPAPSAAKSQTAQRQQPAQQQPQEQQQTSSGRSIMDLRKLIEDFLTRVEGALHTPYDLAKAQKDYEQIAVALAIIEKGMEERDMLNVSDKDMVKGSNLGGVALEELHQRAVLHKSAVDSEFQKISSAASTAKSQCET